MKNASIKTVNKKIANRNTRSTKSANTKPTNKIKMSGTFITFNIMSYFLIGILAIICLVPFILLISGSFTAEQVIRIKGYSILPREFSLEAYRIIFKYPEKIIRAYGVSIFISVVGTATGLFITTMASYVISRKDFLYRNFFSFFFYFTTLFNGGMVSTYIFYIQYLHLKNSYLALILPGLFNVFYLLIMRTFVTTIPAALAESARIDGAGEFTIFIKIILPLLKSGLATIGLFMLLAYWNDWYNAMLYLNTPAKYPLQYMLYDMLMQTQALARIASMAGIKVQDMPTNSLKLAMAVIATGPIILAYPFVQKYFVKGITIGSVKG
jgi:ABC-type sugar transport system, permease component